MYNSKTEFVYQEKKGVLSNIVISVVLLWFLYMVFGLIMKEPSPKAFSDVFVYIIVVLLFISWIWITYLSIADLIDKIKYGEDQYKMNIENNSLIVIHTHNLQDKVSKYQLTDIKKILVETQYFRRDEHTSFYILLKDNRKDSIFQRSYDSLLNKDFISKVIEYWRNNAIELEYNEK